MCGYQVAFELYCMYVESKTSMMALIVSCTMTHTVQYVTPNRSLMVPYSATMAMHHNVMENLFSILIAYLSAVSL